MNFRYDYGNISHHEYAVFILRHPTILRHDTNDREFIGKIIQCKNINSKKTLSIFIHGVDTPELYNNFFLERKLSSYNQNHLPALRIIGFHELNGYHFLKNDDAGLFAWYYWISDPFKRDFFETIT